MKNAFLTLCFLGILTTSCKEKLTPVAIDALKPDVITKQTQYDTDDPAIWINPKDKNASLIIGTDKQDGGGIYAYDLKGNIVNKVTGMQRPNNVDIAYGFIHGKDTVDIAVFTERNANTIRVFTLPDLKAIDGGGIPVFEGQTQPQYNEPMGIALYTKTQDSLRDIYAIVGRKDGPSTNYLWQYKLNSNGQNVTATKVRQFGNYSGKKEIEAIAVDNELGYVYYSDEMAGVRKYYADPSMPDTELAFFATTDMKRDHEGIAIYNKSDSTGYILVSNQQDNSFVVYPRQGTKDNPHDHQSLASIPVSAIECDGAEITSVSLPGFPNGMLVAMSNGKVFHYYNWDLIQKQINQELQK